MPKKITFDAPNRLRDLRATSGEKPLTLAAVADACNTSAAQIQKLETGERELDIGWMRRLARVYGLTAADLLLPEDGGLTADERRIVETRREVPEATRQMIDAMVESLQGFRARGQVVDLDEAKAG